jgi:Carboxypeptidase regulatory-like domain
VLSTGSLLSSAQVILSVLLLLALTVTTANAQVLSGTLTGTVVDSTDAVIPSAKVTVKDMETGKEYAETTDPTGVFIVNNLPNGFFSVAVEQPGFAKAVVERIQVFVSQTSRITVKLEIARTGTEVVVQSEQNLVQTESAELKNTIDRQQIMNLPLVTRNPLDLVKTFAGIISPTASTLGDAFVHGLRGNATNLTQDGINVADNTVKTSGFFAISAPTVDTVGEFNVSVGGIASMPDSARRK